jgi:hypothetical protein
MENGLGAKVFGGMLSDSSKHPDRFGACERGALRPNPVWVRHAGEAGLL